MKKSCVFVSMLVVALMVMLNLNSVKAAGYVNYFGIAMTDDEYNNLVNLGFTTDEIYYMSQETYEENKDANSLLVGSTEKYYKTIYTYLDGSVSNIEISEEEYYQNNDVSLAGTITTSSMKLVSTIAQNDSKYRYKVSIAWTNMPSTRSYDIIGIGFKGNVYINSSVYFNYYKCTSSGCDVYSDYYSKSSSSTGATAIFKFPSDATSFSAGLWFDVSKSVSGTVTSQYMCGDYAHALSTVSANNAKSHSINYTTGIILGSSIKTSYNEIGNAPYIWSGSW